LVLVFSVEDTPIWAYSLSQQPFSESLLLTIILDVFSAYTLTYLFISWVGKPVLDTRPYLWSLPLWKEGGECSGREILKETMCHLRKTVFKEMLQFCLMHPPFWFSTLKSKKATLIWLEGKYSRSLLWEALSYLLNDHTQFLQWIPQLLTWRGTLRSWIDSPVPLTDSFIISHILPSQTKHLMFHLCPSTSFESCNPYLCKKDSPILNSPSEVSTWK